MRLDPEKNVVKRDAKYKKKRSFEMGSMVNTSYIMELWISKSITS